jgi:hypothetical protein
MVHIRGGSTRLWNWLAVFRLEQQLAFTMRRFPPPWTVEQISGGYKVKDATGQSLAYVYGRVEATLESSS